MQPVRLELRGGAPAREAAVVRAARLAGVPVERCEIDRIYLLDRHPGEVALERLLAAVADPVVEAASWRLAHGQSAATIPNGTVEVGRLSGVTDAEGRELEALAARLGLDTLRAASATGYRFDPAPAPHLLERLTREVLANPTVDRWAFGPLAPSFGDPASPHGELVEVVPVRALSPAQLEELSRKRLLSLDRPEMLAIQQFFQDTGRDPTDAELETLAQTWSEHCLHKTFRARIHFTWRQAGGEVRSRETIDGLLATHLRAATDAVAAPWVRSALVDNAGIVAFDDRADLAIKVETHNHPSALEPFGGANTGVGGVVRDILGVSARPIACLDVLCFAPPDTPESEIPAGVLHPRRVAEGVVAGIGDYGNKLGLPTVAGAVVYDPGYLGNPLVYCGAVGLLPTGSHPRDPHPGDAVVVVGGRTGRDGIHGATFSSADLSAETGQIASSAVQIGEPITEKQVMELIDLARDQGLYTAITDCGAGGLSSAVGELASEVGVEVDLADAPRKYAGLQPWEVWLSESQERMVLAVPPDCLDRLRQLGDELAVETTVLGHLTGDRRLVVNHGTLKIVDLPMDFLHGGCPRRELAAEWCEPTRPDGAAPEVTGPADLSAGLLALLRHPDVASKEAIVRTYDHEVRGGTLVRPWCGPGGDGPTDAAVCVPLGHWDTGKAFALAVGINPRLGRVDPYRMAVAAVDEVFRNLVAVGADPGQVALLDNFCWGNPTLPDRLGSLVRASQGCHDAAVAYRAPFVSGKDSLFNEFEGRQIPGTLLITGLAPVPDRTRVVTSAPAAPGLVVYLLGDTKAELGGSLWAEHLAWTGGEVPAPLADPVPRYQAVHRAIRAGLVQAAHDPSEGGLGVALAELCVAGRVGLTISGECHALRAAEWLFAESLGRLILVVRPADVEAFEATVAGQPLLRLGSTTDDASLTVDLDGQAVVRLTLDALVAAWRQQP
jgi:phosphoribosylformylglycinamidine synthase